MTGKVATAAGDAGRSTSTAAAWGLMAVAILLLNIGNIVLEATFKHQQLALAMFFKPGFILAIACLGASFFLYVKALARLPLAVAYPVMVGVSLLIVAAVGYIWFDVDLDVAQVAGIITVFAGVTLISRSSRGSAAERVID